jgi:glycosyltransferase involved in cell wall biosynthesis
MIVRNEALVIERCLDSIKDYIDYWVIVDTGSTDNTIDRIKNSLEDIPGDLYQREWVNFEVNRNQAMELAENKTDYIFLLDADMTVNILEPDFKRRLQAPGYLVEFNANLVYYNIRFVKSDVRWRYFGATHEYLNCIDSTESKVERCPWVTVTHHEDGGFRDDKLERDYQILSNIIEDDPDSFHAQFYMGQTAHGLRNLEESLKWYGQAVRNKNLSANREEIWFSQYCIGLLREELNYPAETIVSAYLQAYELRPWRSEPLYRLAKFYRSRKRYALAHVYAKRGVEIEMPKSDMLYMDKSVYLYLLPIEYSICSYRMKRFSEAIRYANKALDCGELPAEFGMPLLENIGSIVKSYYPPLEIPAQNKNRIVVIVPFRNVKDYIEDCVESILYQDYDMLRVVFVDDCSSDGSSDFIPVDDPRVTLIINSVRKGALCNRIQAVVNECTPEDIVIYVDGDDQLASDDVVTYLNSFYNAHDCWVTYGQFMSHKGAHGWARPFPGEREFRFAFSEKSIRFPIHPVTHRAGLIHQLEKIDPEFDVFRDETGNWIEFASDVAIAKSVFELSGFERVRYIHRVLYIYTDSHSQSDFILDRNAQARSVDLIVNNPVLKSLDSFQTSHWGAKVEL